MDKNNFRFVIQIRKGGEGISPSALFAFLIVVCLPFHTLTIGGVGLLMLIGVPLLIFCSPVLVNKIGQKRWDKATVLLALFFALGITGYLWTPSFSMNSLYNYIQKIFIVVCLYSLPLNGREKKLLIKGSVIACLIICWFMISSRNVTYWEGRMQLAVFGVPQDLNYVGYLFLVSMAVAIHGTLNGKTFASKLLNAAFAVLILYCILTTGSRGALVGIAMIVVVNVISRFKTLGGKIAFCVVMAFVVLVLFNLILLLLPDEIAMRFTIQDVIESRGTHRLDIWADAFSAMWASPHKLLIGFGTGSSIPTIGRATHNFIIQLLLESGIVGTGLFLGFLWIWVKRLFAQDTMCLSIVLGCMMMAMTLSVNTIIYFWAALILGIVCSKVQL